MVAHHNPMRFINNPLIGNNSIIDAKFATKIEKSCTEKCSAIFVPFNYMKEEMRRSHNVIDQCYVIPNYLDEKFINSIKLLRHKSVSDDEYLIFIPSAGSDLKGERYILSIILWISKSVSNRKVVFLLSGKLSKKLDYELSHLTNIKVLSLRQQEYSQNIAYLKSCDLCISPTLLESFGMAILESLVSGVAVVTFNVGGNEDLIDNGRNGYLVDYLNIAELCEKAVSIIQASLDRALIISSTKEKYSLPKIEEKIGFYLKKISEQNNG